MFIIYQQWIYRHECWHCIKSTDTLSHETNSNGNVHTDNVSHQTQASTEKDIRNMFKDCCPPGSLFLSSWETISPRREREMLFRQKRHFPCYQCRPCIEDIKTANK